MSLIARRIEKPLKHALGVHSVVCLRGVRGSGKSVLLSDRLIDGRHYVTLADPEQRQLARNAPRSFLNQLSRPVNLDQVELVPELLRVAEEISKTMPAEGPNGWPPGSLLLAETRGVSPSPKTSFPSFQLWTLAASEQAAASTRAEQGLGGHLQRVLRGGLPAMLAGSDMDAPIIVQRYIDDFRIRDFEPHVQKRYRPKSEQFLALLAQRSAQCPHQAGWARWLGLAPNTVKSWWNKVLRLGLCYETPAYPAAAGPRILRAPRQYLADTGVLAALLGCDSTRALRAGPFARQILTTFVSGELMRLAAHEGETPLLYHWRTVGGAVVDMVFESEGRLHAVVCAVTDRPSRRQCKALRTFLSLLPPFRRGHALAICLRETPDEEEGIQLIPAMKLREF